MGQSEAVYRTRTDNTMANRKTRKKDKQQSTKHYIENKSQSNFP